MWCINAVKLNELLCNDFVLSLSLLPLFWLHDPSLCLLCGIWIFTSLTFSILSHPLLLFFSLFPLPSLYLHCIPPTNHTATPASHHHSLLSPPLSDIRLRVRAEYLEHESALRDGVSSDKQQPLERQFELFSQANSLLRARDLGSIVCDIKFTELDNLEAFWGDYLSGALLEALKGVFITDSLRMAAGTEGVRLLISVDQDDYEEGRKLLRAFSASRRRILSDGNCGHTETHWTV